jgi:glycosidase
MVFPGEQTETWTWDDEANAWYYHRFFDFQPDLNWSNPAVRREVKKIIAFWLQLGASGFRVDATPFILERRTPNGWVQNDFTILDDWRQHLQWIRNDAVLLCEANVDADVIPLGAWRAERPRPDALRVRDQPADLAGAGPASCRAAAQRAEAHDAARRPSAVGHLPAQP